MGNVTNVHAPLHSSDSCTTGAPESVVVHPVRALWHTAEQIVREVFIDCANTGK